MEGIEVIVAHQERVTLRVDDVFLKVDADSARTDREVAAMESAPVPTAEVLWRRPPVLALAALPGSALGRLDEPSTAPASAWVAAGAAVRRLHDAPLPPFAGTTVDEFALQLEEACAWLTEHDVVSAEVLSVNRRIAESALRPWTPAFAHGDLQIAHVFLEGDEVTGILDWSEAGAGDPLFDLATLTLGQEARLDHLLEGYGGDVDLDVIRGWWSLRSLRVIRWLTEHGFDPAPEIAVLESRI